MDKTYTLEELSQLPDGTKIVCDSIPFTMTGSFFTYENWEVQIIRNAIDFKKKYNKWPNFMTANPVTYDNCFADIDPVSGAVIKPVYSSTNHAPDICILL